MDWMIIAAGGGFDPLDPHTSGSLMWTWIIFGLSIYPMWKVVFGPILKALKERDLLASEAVRKAETAQVAAESAKDQVEQELAKARGVAATMMKEARDRAEVLAQERKAQADVEAKRLLEQAQGAIEQEKGKALAEIRKEVVEISCSIAEKALRDKFTDDNQRQQVAQFIEDEWSRN